MSDIDAVITNLELQIESRYVPYGHFVSLRFVDIKPTFPVSYTHLTLPTI